MSGLTVEKVQAVVLSSLEKAGPIAATIKLGEATRTRVAKARAALPDVPIYAELKLGNAIEVWSTIVYVDMRGSTRRAETLGPQKTYLTMHALLPALAYVANQRGGHIVGFRGDGLFAAFGIDDHGREVPESERNGVLGNACVTGLTMVEAVQKAVNPILVDFGVPGDVEIGVGIDVGNIVITRIGLDRTYDLTAYGNAVNRSADLSTGHDEVLMTSDARKMIPMRKDGKLVVSLLSNGSKVTSSTQVLPSAYDNIRGLHHVHSSS